MSQKYRLVITELAEADLRDIADYIANELLEPTTARKMIAKIAEATFQLELMPFINGLVRDERLAADGIRHILVDSYIVFYVISEKEEIVTIIRILYGKRQWSSLL
ncbi:type II toxin-antitoxin system RelE/ParE family toxin [Paenibacillus planticolens]|uniref:Type II toxin-antitoxin system mRNA interferase toxin, RelE/StbE family n=1 Tax=Paenibacillus planticolens TaxID=2654976 RepID=A0ABX1ZPS1_9BACL|nr:type II toxin-antitoxin system RelE/ParE family toxin [Paenibacillus planticolens]NOV00892.1 type II toxin-antitoxin system mRNA interferase toxin, RelE/StbE family [Paenibacillus planticolens]